MGCASGQRCRKPTANRNGKQVTAKAKCDRRAVRGNCRISEPERVGLGTERSVFTGNGAYRQAEEKCDRQCQASNILQITDTVQTELGQPVPFDLYSGPVTAFPNRLRVSQTTIDIARGVGSITGMNPIQTDPTCLISWSDDGGMNWSEPVIRKLGRQVESHYPVRVNRVGHTKDQGRRYRIVVYDPVQVELTGGKMDAEVRNYNG